MPMFKPKRSNKGRMESTSYGANTVLGAGEIFFEKQSSGTTYSEGSGTTNSPVQYRIKIGDGTTKYSDLGYADNVSVDGGSAETGKYVSAISSNGHGISVTKKTLPTDSDTHRPIQMNDTEILGNNTTPLNLKAGNNVTLSNLNGTVTIEATGGGGGISSISGTDSGTGNVITSVASSSGSTVTGTKGEIADLSISSITTDSSTTIAQAVNNVVANKTLKDILGSLKKAVELCNSKKSDSTHNHDGTYLKLSGGTMTGSIITPEDDDMGIIPDADNYGQIGSSSKKFYRGYFNTLYENGSTLSNKYAAKTHSHSEYVSGSVGTNYTKVGNLLIQFNNNLTIGRSRITVTLPTSYSNNSYLICANHTHGVSNGYSSLGDYEIRDQYTGSFKIEQGYTNSGGYNTAESGSKLYWVTIGK